MRIIKSFVDLISKRRKDLSEEQIEDYLNMISTNSEKMSNLVDALHDLGSVSQGDLKKENILLKPFIESIKAEESQSYRDSHISIEYHIDRVFGDPDLLRRLFSNLLSNALKFSSAESTAIVDIQCFERRGYFCFRISDNGIGIAEEKRTEVFELFNRQTNYSDYKGLGIGLALSKKIVDMHASTIHILDIDLGGVCFEVRLPLS
jgi:signal transduction histidine kinase